jgi:hypothetical protein
VAIATIEIQKHFFLIRPRHDEIQLPVAVHVGDRDRAGLDSARDVDRRVERGVAVVAQRHQLARPAADVQNDEVEIAIAVQIFGSERRRCFTDRDRLRRPETAVALCNEEDRFPAPLLAVTRFLLAVGVQVASQERRRGGAGGELAPASEAAIAVAGHENESLRAAVGTDEIEALVAIERCDRPGRAGVELVDVWLGEMSVAATEQRRDRAARHCDDVHHPVTVDVGQLQARRRRAFDPLDVRRQGLRATDRHQHAVAGIALRPRCDRRDEIAFAVTIEIADGEVGRDAIHGVLRHGGETAFGISEPEGERLGHAACGHQVHAAIGVQVAGRDRNRLLAAGEPQFRLEPTGFLREEHRHAAAVGPRGVFGRHRFESLGARHAGPHVDDDEVLSSIAIEIRGERRQRSPSGRQIATSNERSVALAGPDRDAAGHRVARLRDRALPSRSKSPSVSPIGPEPTP